MCTVTWTLTDDGYHLFCNRDERKSRAAASAPHIRQKEGVRYVAPADGESGGAWIAANEYGLTVCLLNGDVVSGRTSERDGSRSRGLALLDLIASRSTHAACERFLQMDLTPVAAFRLVVLDLGGPAVVGEWSGGEKTVVASSDSLLPLVSSSFDSSGVRASRRAEFRRCTDGGRSMNPDRLLAFHHGHDPVPGAYSACMHRADAETVSFSAVQMDRKYARFTYWASAPCRNPAVMRSTLSVCGEDR